MRSVLFGAVAFGLCAQIAVAQDAKGSYVVQHAKTPDGKFISRTVPYEPRAGDLVFFDDYKPHWMFLYKMVGSDRPHHAAVVFRKPDGEFATAEAGPNDTLHCRVLALSPRLQEYPGVLHIRRVKTPLSAEKEATMAKWCLEQEGKRYALGRLLLQATPIRCRGPVRRDLFGTTYTDRSSYMCAELAIAGGTVAGLFDPRKAPGNAIYPRDIIYNDKYDLSATHHEAELWSAYPLH
jgi:hypothetical protein